MGYFEFCSNYIYLRSMNEEAWRDGWMKRRKKKKRRGGGGRFRTLLYYIVLYISLTYLSSFYLD